MTVGVTPRVKVPALGVSTTVVVPAAKNAPAMVSANVWVPRLTPGALGSAATLAELVKPAIGMTAFTTEPLASKLRAVATLMFARGCGGADVEGNDAQVDLVRVGVVSSDQMEHTRWEYTRQGGRDDVPTPLTGLVL